MANMCNNQLVVRGEAEDITRFLREAVAEDTAQQTVLQDYEGYIKCEEDNRLNLYMLSRHSPPLRVLVGLSRQFPTLTFYLEWEEGSVGLFGSAFVQEGVGVSVEQGWCCERWQLPQDLPEESKELPASRPSAFGNCLE